MISIPDVLELVGKVCVSFHGFLMFSAAVLVFLSCMVIIKNVMRWKHV